ncbi:DNA-processing protein DprA [Bacillaceae bacterium Marseille-Q3522]|nr:DNA-processing protein DprA [Bacillaceae bacterium Marseille-Q3522]
MKDFKLKFIHLLHCRGMTWKRMWKILNLDPSLHSICERGEIPQHLFTPAEQSDFLADLHSNDISEKIRQYRYHHLQIITIFDEEYPFLLKQIYQPPWILYAAGDLSLLKQKRLLAVVGSRQASEYGKNALKQMIPPLVDAGVIIVSGLAAGIDCFAHKMAIQNGGKTIAVIAGGHFHIYPKANIKLAQEIMRNHLIISEYPPYTKPQKWQFPMRNRIISGICHGTFVVEAKKKSGSLITANYAVNEGRDVFALPGSIFHAYSAGTNDLIQQGAKLVNDYHAILEEWT